MQVVKIDFSKEVELRKKTQVKTILEPSWGCKVNLVALYSAPGTPTAACSLGSNSSHLQGLLQIFL